ncbi:MAG: DUF3857 domain-containing protein [Planctomycetes bacterium]|nr:DUF3857 domain-containing protein [Planctomycetota bacterium]
MSGPIDFRRLLDRSASEDGGGEVERRVARSRVTARLGIAAWLGLAFVSSAHAQATKLSEIIWGREYRADRELESLEEVEAALDRMPEGTVAGLDVEGSRLVAEEILLRALRDRAISSGRTADAGSVVRRFLERPSHPYVETLARSLLGYLEWNTGNFDDAQSQWRTLEYANDWWVIGPFENERGSGFGTPHAIESSVDFDAVFPGKRNTVGWRRFSGMTRGGMIELGELLDPDEEALAFLVTHVHCDAPTRAVLRLGSTGSIAVWLGAVEVLRVDVERPLHFDQDAVVVDLPAGWTRVLIKSGQTKGAWAVRARWTDELGAPIGLLTRGSVEAGTPLASGAQRVGGVPFQGATTLLSEAPLDRLSPAEKAATLRLRGYLAMDRTVHDVDEHPDRELFLAANEVAPSAVGSYLVARTLRPEITHSAQREENRWRVSIERALELDPTFDRATLDLAEYYQRRFGNWTRVRELIEPLLRDSRPSVRAMDLAAALTEFRLGAPAARAWQQRAVDRRLRDGSSASVRRSEARRLRTRGEIDAAESLLREGVKVNGSDVGLRQDLAAIELDRDRPERAREWLTPLCDAYPQHTQPYRELARLESSYDRFDAALVDLGSALALRPQDPELHRLQGDCLIQAGRPEVAVEAFRDSLELDPNQPRLREQVEALSSSSSRFGLAYRVDPDPLIASALAAGEADNDPYRVLLDNTAVEIHADGTTSRFRQYLVKVINDQGVRALDYYPIAYAQGEEWVDVTVARVHRGDGRHEDARIRNRPPEVREGEYPVWSNAWVDLPALRPGDVVEIEYHQEDLKQSFFGDYFGDRIVFGSSVPIDRMVYTIEAPREKKLYFHGARLTVTPSTTAERERTIRCWSAEHLAKIDPEPSMPDVAELAPVLEVSTFEDWTEFAHWYHHLIRKQHESSDEIRAKVAELTEGVSDVRERIRRLYEFVVTEVRYIAWEFGVHGFKPYNASTIFTRRFGDCKDKATLLCTMLGEIGVPAYPVLIHAETRRSREDLTLPLINHFNHCIAYIPDAGDGRPMFVDGTAENHGLDQLPMMDRGAEVLVVRPDEGDLVPIPWNTPTEQAIHESVEVAVRADGSAQITQRDVVTGDYAVGVRSGFEIEGQRKRRLEQLLSRRYPGVVVDDVETTDLEDLTQTPALTLRLSVPEWADANGDGLKLPSLQDLFNTVNPVASLASRVEREHDLLLGNPSLSELTVEITLPPGVEVKHLPESFRLTSPDATFAFQASVTGQKIELRRTYEQSAPRVEASDYPSFREIADRIRELARERIVLNKIEEVE